MSSRRGGRRAIRSVGEQHSFTEEPGQKRQQHGRSMSQAKKARVEIESPSKHKVKAAFLGGTFSFTYNAAREFFTTLDLDDFKSGRSVKSVFAQVESGECDYGILPAESSTTGSIGTVNDHLLTFSERGISILAESRNKERISLVAKDGVKDVDIERIHGHHHLMDACADYLDLLDEKRSIGGKGPVERVVALDSSTACSLVSDTRAAAIANAEAANYHNLSVIHEHIGGDLNSETRYIVIGKADPLKLGSVDANSPRKSRRGSVVFACNNEPGQVMKWSSCFAFRNLSILKIDSRPASVAMHLNRTQTLFHVRHFDILFFVDFEVVDSKTYTSCINNLQDFVSFFRALGVYEQCSGKPLPASPNEEMLAVYY